MIHPTSLGEWDKEIASKSDAELLQYKAALRTLREWENFKEAFKFSLMFVVEQSIGFELDKREAKR
jgi:hypothetical protein